MSAGRHSWKPLLSSLVAADSRFHNLGPLFCCSLFSLSVTMTTAFNCLQSIKENQIYGSVTITSAGQGLGVKVRFTSEHPWNRRARSSRLADANSRESSAWRCRDAFSQHAAIKAGKQQRDQRRSPEGSRRPPAPPAATFPKDCEINRLLSDSKRCLQHN